MDKPWMKPTPLIPFRLPVKETTIRIRPIEESTEAMV